MFAVISLLMTAFAFAAPSFPALTGRVVDAAHVLTADQVIILSNRLRDFEDQSGHQMAIATVPSLQGYDIRDFGYQLGRAWALGKKDKNDGVVVLVAPTEHKVSIEVGYGLEGDLTDAMSSIIINQAMVPKFKAGDYFSGLYSGLDDIQKVVGGQGDQVVQAAKNQSAPQAGLVDAIPFIFFFFIVLIIIFNASRGRGIIIVPGGSLGRSSGWSSGGGGFSGGGGSFGGGGASGGW
jgi:uncharacterized protein